MSVPGGRWVERLAATITGHGERWVVLGHGFGTDQRSWHHQAQALERRGLRVLRYDLAGATARTQPAFDPDRHRSLFGFAEDLAMLLEELGVRDASFVGHSLGGMVGLLAANGLPGVFERLVCIGASARYVDDPASGYVGGLSDQAVRDLLAHMGSNYIAWANGFAASMVGSGGPHLDAPQFTRSLLRMRPDIALIILRAALLGDHRADVDALRTPLYLIHASDDPAVPAAAANWLAEHGRAQRLTVVDARGHLPHMANPQPVTDALLDCLALNS